MPCHELGARTGRSHSLPASGSRRGFRRLCPGGRASHACRATKKSRTHQRVFDIPLRPEYQPRSVGRSCPIVDEIGMAAKVGYEGMEPWIDELQRYAEAGGSLPDLGKRFRDAGIRVESAIDFFEWAVDDEARRKKGLEAARKSMEMLRKIGGKRLAAPPVGATENASRSGAPRRALSSAPGAGRYDGRGSPGRGLGFFKDTRPAGRGCHGRHRIGSPQGVHPARRLPPLQRRIIACGHQASCPRRHSRLPRQRLSRRSPTAQAHRRRPYLCRATASPRTRPCFATCARAAFR